MEIRNNRKIGNKMNNHFGLSDRELQILHLILSEHTTAEIAKQLFLSIDTIKSHRRNMYRKVRTRTVVGLVKSAFENDLIGK